MARAERSHQADEQVEIQAQRTRGWRPPTGGVRLADLSSQSPRMQRIHQTAVRIAPTPISVFITGESGTGKDVLARSIHSLSDRSDAPFVAINCAAIPEGLLEAELFGHTRGAFSGAQAERDGLFVEASGGTLFLDEVGEMPPALQAKILRALQEREVRPIGGNRSLPVDVRIISATNAAVEEHIRQGLLRADLFYRLNGIRIDMPPLRERPEDVVGLARTFLDRYAGPEGLCFAKEAEEALVRQPWHGNLRELENVVIRGVALAGSNVIELADLALESHAAPLGGEAPAPLEALVRDALEQGLTLRELEAVYLREAMERSNGNKAEVASRMGISRATLYRKLQDLKRAD